MGESTQTRIDKTIEKKAALPIVVVGHVDHGKSTVIGKLLYDTHSLPEGAVEKVERIAKETGKPFEYAYLLDAFEEEQKQGITIDTTQIQFFTDKRDYVIIDAPGHKEFLKNMISGAANAEAALLIIDAQQGVQEQSKRHGYMLSLLGIQKVYVVVNKMDLVAYKQSVFDKVSQEMKDFLVPLGITPLQYIPVSAMAGENIVTISEKMPWYKGASLLKALDELEDSENFIDKPLRFPIQDVYKFDSRRIIAGRVESGQLAVGDSLIIYPSGRKTKVESIPYWAKRDKKTKILAGQSSGITLHDEFFNQRGELITKVGEKPPYVSNRFLASIFWMGKNNLTPHKKYKLKLATQEVEVEVEKIEKSIDASSLNSNNHVKALKINDVGQVLLKTKKLVSFDLFRDNQATGRFVIVDGYDVAGGGIILRKEETYKEEVPQTFIGNGLAGRGDLFDDYYYDLANFKLIRSEALPHTYHVGDTIPVVGDTYHYPNAFDILILRDKVAISIRGGKMTAILPIEQYVYTELPMVNGRGFALQVTSQADIEKLIDTYVALNHSNREEVLTFANRYYNLSMYRDVKFGYQVR